MAFSVVGQCLHYKLTRSISERLIGSDAFGKLDPDYLTDHITRFTLAALGHDAPIDSPTGVDEALSRKETLG